jgi:general secretion pathway protein G
MKNSAKNCSVSTKGFTLIELMMVVFIIGLITSLALPNFLSHRDQTAIDVTKANLENLRTVIALFYQEEEQWPSDDLSDLLLAPSGKMYIGTIPKEAICKSNQVVNVPPAGGNDGGWYWNPTNHILLPNIYGADANGDRYDSY